MKHENCNKTRWMHTDYHTGLVSVIVPTYNRSSLLIKTLKSVLDQAYRPIEVIIIDDGSTDDTRNVVEVWKSKNEVISNFLIKYIYQENSGAPIARNLGLINSNGEFIFFLDSDDYLHPNLFDTHVFLLEHNKDYSKIACQYINFYNDIDLEHKLSLSLCNKHDPEPIEPNLCKDWRFYPGHSCDGIYRRKLVAENGPWKNLPVLQDREYTLRLYFAGIPQLSIQWPPVFVRSSGSDRLTIIQSDIRGATRLHQAALEIYDLCVKAEDKCSNADWDALARLFQNISRKGLVSKNSELALSAFIMSKKCARSLKIKCRSWLLGIVSKLFFIYTKIRKAGNNGG